MFGVWWRAGASVIMTGISRPKSLMRREVSAEPRTEMWKYRRQYLMIFKNIWSPPLKLLPRLLLAMTSKEGFLFDNKLL